MRTVPLPPCCVVQELCSCSLRKVLEYRAFQRNPDKLVSARLSACHQHARAMRQSPRGKLGPCALSQATVGDVLHQVALGLEYLHSKGIIHGGASLP